MNVFKMGWRNVLRNRRRTAVTVSAMAFALTAEVLYSGLLPGLLQGMEDDVVDLEMGDMQVFGGDYLERPSLWERIEDHHGLLEKLDAAGYPAAPRLNGGGLMAAGENSAGVAFRGVEVERDAKVSLIGQKVATGTWLDASDRKGVVVGKALARTLGVKPGDEVVVLTQATDGSMANDLFHVRGILMSVAGGTDRGIVYMNADAFRDLLVFPEGAHQLLVRRPDDVPLPDAAQVVKDLLAADGKTLTVKTWKELNPVIGTMLESTGALIGMMSFIFYIAVGILVLNAMLMAVFERIREFGVLKAIGTGPGRVFSLILVESFAQTVLALIVGGVLSVPGARYLTVHGLDMASVGGTDLMGVALRPIWYGIYTPDVLVTPVLMLLFVVFLSVLYPAAKAALIEPVAAMQHQ